MGDAARVLRGSDQPLGSRTTETISALAEGAGWGVQWSEEQNPLHLVFLLRPR